MKPEYIIIHHSLTKDGKVVDWNAIRHYHMNDPNHKYKDIGYHYGVEQIGEKWAILTGRAENEVGAHTKQNKMNFKSLGICFVGNFDTQRPPEEGLSLLEDLCVTLCRKYDLPYTRIDPHSKYANYKTCPGKMFPMAELRERVRKRLC